MSEAQPAPSEGQPAPSEGKKVTSLGVLKALVFILGIQAAAVLLTYLNAPVFSLSGYSYAPLGTSPAGSAGNTLLLVLVVFATTLALVWILRQKRVLSFKIIVFGATVLSAFSLTLITVDSVTLYFFNFSSPLFDLLLSFVPVALLGYTTFVKASSRISSGVLALLSAEVGSYFASTLPLITALLFPIAFSLYDVYAVFRGPLRELVSAAPASALGVISVKAGEFTIGLGDTVFYSMLPSLAIYQLNILGAAVSVSAAVVTIAAVDAGMVFTLYLLTKKKLLPGLPIPMVLGVASLLLFLR
ncbi:MAG: hypothetical protein E6K89_03340 [Thaumarchaeota archaeon]|nr:MAG: hypothetical protein E6K89_03340 [Nitrososphaerota archaeon]